ncbi:hypothetical protein K0M31_015918 [Melipona bicolor]|uniref:Uncharacterized protein n=1 Tax=Melipona bicolor TaxID=60889 RepID=A0AA40KSY5_9HYME|nr:hypothetical protein K0M31_015918 [Melipona bicolor]
MFYFSPLMPRFFFILKPKSQNEHRWTPIDKSALLITASRHCTTQIYFKATPGERVAGRGSVIGCESGKEGWRRMAGGGSEALTFSLAMEERQGRTSRAPQFHNDLSTPLHR